MSVNPDSIPRYAEYPAEMDPTPLDCMERCVHKGACTRAYEMLMGKTDYYGWTEKMARLLGCGEDCECAEFEE